MSITIHTMQELPNHGGWSVGYFGPMVVVVPANPPGTPYPFTASSQEMWVEICRFKEVLDAVRRVNLLNGGNGQVS